MSPGGRGAPDREHDPGPAAARERAQALAMELLK